MSLADFLYPKFCLGCGLPGVYICPVCLKKIPPIQRQFCLVCNRSSHMGLTHPLCSINYNIDGALSVYVYTPLVRKIVKNIKYRLAREIMTELTRNIRPEHLENILKMKKLYGEALIQPIPLTNTKLKRRGFNQAHLIADYFSMVLGLETGNLIQRAGVDRPQAELKSRSDREKNIRGVFGLRPEVNLKSRTVILIDDIITTGSTVKEAAKTLKKNGAEKVYAISLARG